MGVSTVEWLANFGVAGIVVILIVTGLLVPGFIYRDLERANEKLNDAIAIERQRNTDLQQMAVTSTKAITAVAQVAEENRLLLRRRDRQGTPPAGISVGGPD